MPDAAPDAELVVLVLDVVEVVFDALPESPLVVAVGAEPEVGLEVGAGLDVGAGVLAAGGAEVWVGWGCVEPWPDPASGSVYCWSPADGPLARTAAGASSTTTKVSIRDKTSLRGI